MFLFYQPFFSIDRKLCVLAGWGSCCCLLVNIYPTVWSQLVRPEWFSTITNPTNHTMYQYGTWQTLVDTILLYLTNSPNEMVVKLPYKADNLLPDNLNWQTGGKLGNSPNTILPDKLVVKLQSQLIILKPLTPALHFTYVRLFFKINFLLSYRKI